MPRFRIDIPASGPTTLPTVHAAVISWALSRALDGDLVLRQAAARGPAAPPLLADLHLLGVDWDEGPAIGGEYGPYVQSDRGARYQAIVEKLLATGLAQRSAAGVLLQPVAGARGGFDDALRGAQPVSPPGPDQRLLLDRAGTPSVQLRTVVDDHDMAITHAVHPAEDLAFCGAVTALIDALGWSPPTWVILPPLMDPAGAPLADQPDYDVAGLSAAGYLPETIRNYLLLCGWTPAADEEILDRWTMRRLQLDRFSPAPVPFDQALLDRLNRHYLAQLDDSALAALVQPLLDADYGALPAGDRWLVALVALLRPGLTQLTEIVDRSAWAFATNFEYTDAARAALLQDKAGLVLVRLVAAIARDAVLLDEETAAHVLTRLGEQLHLDQTHPAIPAALLGRLDGPPLPAVCALLGREETLQRLAAAIRWRNRAGPA